MEYVNKKITNNNKKIITNHHKQTFNTSNTNNNINYVSRNGAGWSWFKSMFIVVLFAILSTIFFTGSIPSAYMSSVQEKTIKTQIGTSYEFVEGNKETFYNNLTPDNIQNYTFFPESPQNLDILENYKLIDLIGLYGYVNNMVSIIEIKGANSTKYGFYSGSSVGESPLYLSKISNLYYLYSRTGSSSSWLWNISSNAYPSSLGNIVYIKFTDYFDFGTAYYNKYGSDLTQFNKLKEFLYYTTYSDYDDIITEVPIYSEYHIKYSVYNWDKKIIQLSRFKNIFEPLFNVNTELDTIQYNLNNAFNYLKTGIKLKYISYVGSDTSYTGANNNNFADNWEYNYLDLLNPYAELYDYNSYIAFFSSKYGQLINLNYYYDTLTEEFIRYDNNNYYGVSVDEPPKQILKYVANFLSYPITTIFNITYDIGVIFNFIFNW